MLTPRQMTDEEIAGLIYKHKGIRPYSQQFKAAKELSKGNIVNQNTGEGKTISVLIALIYKLLEGHKVYIVTSNNYLSERDYLYAKPVLDELGFTSCFIKDGCQRYLYESDAIFATGETLIFD